MNEDVRRLFRNLGYTLRLFAFSDLRVCYFKVTIQFIASELKRKLQ